MLNRRLNLAIALSSALILAGCAGSPERTDFVEIGNNTYTISASSNSTDNGGIVRVELIKQAQEFCSDKDLRFRLLNSRFNDSNDDKSATATIDFVCESHTAASANHPPQPAPKDEVPSAKVPSVLVPSAQPR